MPRLKIGILFGGVSEEHPISVKSAQEVAKCLDPGTYDVSFIGITKSGEWRLCDSPEPGWEDRASRPAVLSPDRGAHGLLVGSGAGIDKITDPVMLPVLDRDKGDVFTQTLYRLAVN